MTIQILHMPQTERGCGNRVHNGLYAIFDLAFVERCPNLPLPLPEICPVCGEGIRQSRTIRYVIPNKLLKPVHQKCHSPTCPVCNPPDQKCGLMWVGEQYYSAVQFVDEALKMGISKRIPIKFDLPIGSVVYFAHPNAIRIGNAVFDEREAPHRMKHSQTKPGIFLAARLSAYHKIIDEKQAKDEKFTKSLIEQGITPVVEVPEVKRPEETTVHIDMDKASREVRLTAPYRGTCLKCNKPYGYKGKNPGYCPDCLKAMKRRGEEAVKPVEKKKKKVK